MLNSPPLEMRFWVGRLKYMTNAKKDQNSVSTIIGALNSDGVTPTNIKIDPTTHVLQNSDGATGSDHTGTKLPADGNNVPLAMGLSSVDGVTPVVIYVDSSNNLLTNSN